MKKRLHIPILAILFIGPYGLNAQELSEPERLFEALWKTYDGRYAIFLPKRVDDRRHAPGLDPGSRSSGVPRGNAPLVAGRGSCPAREGGQGGRVSRRPLEGNAERSPQVDWDALYKVYRPKVTPQTTDDELFEIMSNMLGHLNDNHVRLMTADRKKAFSAGILNRIYAEQFENSDEVSRFMRERPVGEGRVKGGYQTRLNGRFAFGRVADDIGYFHFSGFGDVDGSGKVVDQDGFCWEGIGVPPDLMVVNSKEDLAKGRDRVLDLAIDLIKTGAMTPRPNRCRSCPAPRP